ncbi:F0F1 ATP synthase subunit beta [Mycobacterium tuberculosis]|nr:F0F1 ATP synthase subunit beta [Mycobacterium tuberculosis]
MVRVTGPVVDVEFPRGSIPELFNALHAEITFESLAKTLTLEVAQHLGRWTSRRAPVCVLRCLR